MEEVFLQQSLLQQLDRDYKILDVAEDKKITVISTIDQMQLVWLSQIDYVKAGTKVSLHDKAPVQTEKASDSGVIFTVTFSIIPSFLVAHVSFSCL